jgi:SRSO17 transposase
VADSFAAFHQEFAPRFGRSEARERSEQYLRGLLVQQTDRRNAENLAEAIEGATPRALPWFLTEATWSDQAVTQRLPVYVGRRLGGSLKVYIVDDTGFAKQGRKSVGVTLQYSGTLGKVADCQVGVFLAWAAAQGHALVDKALRLPREWTQDRDRCRAAGVPEEIDYRSKAELALDLLRQARQSGHWPTDWVTAAAGYGAVPSFRDTLATEDWRYVVAVPSTLTVFPQPVQTAVPAGSGRGRQPTREPVVAGEPHAQTVAAGAAQGPAAQWRTLTVAEGAQGPRTYQFAAAQVWECRDGLPGRESWLLVRCNLEGSELKYHLANAPADTPLLQLAQVSALRWPVETEFQTEKGETDLDEYEVRSWQGWRHHITMALLAGAVLLSLQQAWGEKLPQLTRPQLTRVLRELLPQRTWTKAELWDWLHDAQRRNQQAKQAHADRRRVIQILAADRLRCT